MHHPLHYTIHRKEFTEKTNRGLGKAKAHDCRALFGVEMAGIEPASERFDPQISTSVVVRDCRRHVLRTTEGTADQPLGPESPSFARLAA